ncbi:MAG: hypothetical protein WBH36_04130, partial [Syntrophobacteria bacterium]
WHTLLHGLATAIHETSGLEERRAGEILQAHDMIISGEELSKKRDSFSSGPPCPFCVSPYPGV